ASHSSAPVEPPKSKPLLRTGSQTNALAHGLPGAFINVRLSHASAAGSHSHVWGVSPGLSPAPWITTRWLAGSYAATAIRMGPGRVAGAVFGTRSAQTPQAPSHSHRSAEWPASGYDSPPNTNMRLRALS